MFTVLVESADALLERQERLVNLCALYPCLPDVCVCVYIYVYVYIEARDTYIYVHT